MSDKEKLYTAKLYMEKLSNGINPLDNEPVPNDTVLNNVYLCRCFVFLSDLVSQVIENGCEVGRMPNKKKDPFRITEEQRAEIDITEKPVGISVIAKRVGEVLEPTVKRIQVVQFTDWLEAEGLLETVITEGKRERIATEDGQKMGIVTEESFYEGRPSYKKNFYSASAQAFLIANLESIAEYKRPVEKK